MARNKGLAAFSANFEPQMAAPLDARSTVETITDLVTPAIWEAGDGSIYAYVGMRVTVTDSPDPADNGMYYLSAADYTDAGNWVKAGGGHVIEDAGTPVTQRAALNFKTGFTVTDDAGNDATDIDVDSDLTVTQVTATEGYLLAVTIGEQTGTASAVDGDGANPAVITFEYNMTTLITDDEVKITLPASATTHTAADTYEYMLPAAYNATDFLAAFNDNANWTDSLSGVFSIVADELVFTYTANGAQTDLADAALHYTINIEPDVNYYEFLDFGEVYGGQKLYRAPAGGGWVLWYNTGESEWWISIAAGSAGAGWTSATLDGTYVAKDAAGSFTVSFEAVSIAESTALGYTHNVSPDLQGGDTGEYYHLDATDYANRQVPFVLNPDATGLDADLTTYNAQLTGFLYFATDTKKAYWKTSDLDGNHWSVGAQLGWQPFLHIQDQKAQGTNGGTFTSGAWRTRDLNTVLTNTIPGASLATNQITLPAGKYYVEASAPVFSYENAEIHNTRTQIYSTTDTSTLINGLSYQARRLLNGGLFTVQCRSYGTFQVDKETDIELQHRCATTGTTYGFGIASGYATEVYSDIRIWRIGEYVAP